MTGVEDPGIVITFTFQHFIYGLTEEDSPLALGTAARLRGLMSARAKSAQMNYTEEDELPLEVFFPTCKTWDTELQAFSSEGCTVQKLTREYVTCKCDRIADTAVFIWADPGSTTPGPGPQPLGTPAPLDHPGVFLGTVAAVLISILVALSILAVLVGLWYYKRPMGMSREEMALLITQWREGEEWGYQRRRLKERPALDDLPPSSVNFSVVATLQELLT